MILGLIPRRLNVLSNSGSGLELVVSRFDSSPVRLVLGALVLLFSLIAQSAPFTLPAPAELKQKAQQSRTDFLHVLLDIEAQVHNIRDPQTFHSYFVLMDDWEELFKTWQLDDLYPDAVYNLGNKMIAHGMKWLELWRVSTSDLHRYLRYFDDQNYWSLQNLTFYNIKRLKPLTLVEYERAYSHLEIIRHLYVLPKYAHRVDLLQSIMDLQGYLALLALQLPLEPSEVTKWRTRLNSPNSLAELLVDWEERLKVPEQLSPNSTMDITELSILISQKSKELESLFSVNWLIEKALALWVDTFELALRHNWDFDSEAASRLFNLINSSQLKFLSQRIVSIDEKLWSEKATESAIKVAKILGEFLRKTPWLDSEARRYEQWLSRIIAIVSVRASQLAEGTYRLKSSKDKVFYLTIARYEAARLAVGLMDEWQFFGLKFFHLSYDVKTDQWVAMYSENTNDLKDYPHIIRIKKIDHNTIRIINSYALLDDRELIGERVEDFPAASMTPGRFLTEGIYDFQGLIRYTKKNSAGSALKAQLTLQVVGDVVVGRLSFEGQTFWYDFKTGLLSSERDLVLTAEIKSTTWVQLRGKLRPDGSIEAILIVGGRGVSTEKIHFYPMPTESF